MTLLLIGGLIFVMVSVLNFAYVIALQSTMLSTQYMLYRYIATGQYANAPVDYMRLMIPSMITGAIGLVLFISYVIENRKKGLHVLVAAPGFTASNIRKTALNAEGRQQGESPRNEGKMMSAERCAAIIMKGIRKRKREIIMTFVEGKLAVFLSKWMPRLVDRLSYSHMAKEPDSPFK